MEDVFEGSPADILGDALSAPGGPANGAVHEGRFLKASIKALLEDECAIAAGGGLDPEETGWSLQGLGMLRMYLGSDKKYRLHVWDARYRETDVTMLHDHPWDFESTVVAGKVCNQRYVPSIWGTVHLLQQEIVCGPGGGVCEAARPINMEALPVESVYAGQQYMQKADEVHISLPENGTVTIIDRTFHQDTEKACVYYYPDAGWVSAEPRPAHCNEIEDILSYSLERWF